LADGSRWLSVFGEPSFGGVFERSIEVFAGGGVQPAMKHGADEFAGFVDACELLGHAQLCGVSSRGVMFTATTQRARRHPSLRQDGHGRTIA
jgi:hypothetical protein